MKTGLAFVLGGGGARGAMQVGALRALLEAGLVPDLLVGTSIGAVNAAGLALWGLDLDGIDALERAYAEIANSGLMDPSLGRLALRTLLGRPNDQASRRVADVLALNGFTPDVRFDQITGARLAMVGADLDTGEPVIYGQDPSQSVLEGLLASTALPPWFPAREKDGRMIVDGGFVSNLPIEPALLMGAKEIIALDLDDPRPTPGNQHPVNQYIDKLSFAVHQRSKRLEIALAEAQGVPVRCIELKGVAPVPIWDFGKYQELIRTGYEIAALALEQQASQVAGKAEADTYTARPHHIGCDTVLQTGPQDATASAALTRPGIALACGADDASELQG